MSSLEGGRGWPRLKPPFPAGKGLWGKPTIVNNVETIANLPWIIEHGGKAFADLGIGRSGGLRLVSVCGHVKRPGVYELPLTVTGNELIEEICGGMRGGRKVKGVIPGGVSMPVLAADEDAVPQDVAIRVKRGTIRAQDRCTGVERVPQRLVIAAGEGLGEQVLPDGSGPAVQGDREGSGHVSSDASARQWRAMSSWVAIQTSPRAVICSSSADRMKMRLR